MFLTPLIMYVCMYVCGSSDDDEQAEEEDVSSSSR